MTKIVNVNSEERQTTCAEIGDILSILTDTGSRIAAIMQTSEKPERVLPDLVSVVFESSHLYPEIVAFEVTDLDAKESFRLFQKNGSGQIVEVSGNKVPIQGILGASSRVLEDSENGYCITEPSKGKLNDSGEYIEPTVMAALFPNPILGLSAIFTVRRVSEFGAFTSQDMDVLRGITSQLMIVLAARKRLKEQLDTELLDKELDVARTIQQRLLPRGRPGLIGLDLSALNIPAKSVSGDYYDYISHDKEKVGFVIADVAGKGVPAAMIMALTRTLLRSAASRFSDPGEILQEVNQHLLEDMEGFRFVTMFYAVLDYRARTIQYSRAGHVPPILYKASDNSCSLLDGPGLFLGIFRDKIFETAEISLEPGDAVLFYTDGVCDAVNSEGQEYGIERLQEVFKKNASLDSRLLIDAIYSDITDFADGTPFNDDVTLMSLSLKSLDELQELVFPSRRNIIPVLVSHIWDKMKETGIKESSEFFKVKLIVDELVSNAIDHGNRLAEDKRIFVSYTLDKSSMEMVIRDEGHGFDWPAVMESISDRLGVLLNRGRGILITREVSDTLFYNEKGNEVYVLKRFEN